MQTIQYRAYDLYQNNIYDVLEIDFVGQKVKTHFMDKFHNWISMTDTVLLQFTGAYVAENPVYEGDLISSDEKVYLVRYDENALAYVASNINKPSEQYALRDIVHKDNCVIYGNGYTMKHLTQ